jgi:hypothetical protein
VKLRAVFTAAAVFALLGVPDLALGSRPATATERLAFIAAARRTSPLPMRRLGLARHCGQELVRVSTVAPGWGGYWFKQRPGKPKAACTSLYAFSQPGGSFPAGWILRRAGRGMWIATAIGGWDEACLRARATKIPAKAFHDIFGFASC